MVTLKEIARECNVSATTVSNILNGKPKVSEATRQKVMQVVKKRGYQPNYVAQGLRNQRTRTIAVIAEDIGQFTTPGIIESVMARFESEGYHTILWNLRLYARWSESWYNNEQAYRSILNPVLQELRSIKVEGVIYVAGHARLIHCTTQDYEVPMIMAYAYPDLPGIPSVTIDEEKSGYDMVKYLLSMGHKRIGFIGGRANNIHTQKRLYGAQRAMFESHVPYNPEWVRYGDWFRRSGYEEAGPLVQAGVTAIFCMADRMAGGVYDYLEEKGLRAGEDISVTGFDNQDLSEYCRPALTTMDLPLTEIGNRASLLLLERLKEREIGTESKKAAENISIPCTLVERKSVKQLTI